MAYLKGHRHKEKYTCVRVSWINWQEHETYDFIKGGSVEYSTDSELKVTGSFPFEGYLIPNTNDLIRIYYSFEDNYGDSFRKAIATFVASYAELVYEETRKGIKASGTLDGASVLTILSDKIIGRPTTISKNANAVYAAEQLVKSCGLLTDAEPSGFTLSADHTFDAGTSYLEMVNWLLTSASFVEAYPDEMGVVQMRSQESTIGSHYTETINALYPSTHLYPGAGIYPSKNITSNGVEFKADEESILYPQVSEESSWQTTPNIVRLLYNVDNACIIAEAKNLSGSRASLEERGNREITYFSEIGELGTGNKVEYMKELAERTLRELSCDTEYVTINHAYVPIELYTPIKVRYGDLEWDGNVDNYSINLAPSTKTQTKIVKTLYQEIAVESSATVIRGE